MRGSGACIRLRRSLVMRLRFALVRHLRLALHLQPVLFQLLRVDAIAPGSWCGCALLRPALATIADDRPDRRRHGHDRHGCGARGAAPRRPAAADDCRPRAAFGLAARVAAVAAAAGAGGAGPAGARPAAVARLAFCLRQFALLRTVRLADDPGAVAAVAAGAGRAAAAGRACASRSPRCWLRPAAASVALLVAPAVRHVRRVRHVHRVRHARRGDGRAGRAIRRADVRTLRALRPCRTHRRFVGRGRLLGRLLRLEPAEQAAEES